MFESRRWYRQPPHYPVLHAPTARAPPMTRFLARRLLNYIVLLALASFLTFTLTSLTFTPLNST